MAQVLYCILAYDFLSEDNKSISPGKETQDVCTEVAEDISRNTDSKDHVWLLSSAAYPTQHDGENTLGEAILEYFDAHCDHGCGSINYVRWRQPWTWTTLSELRRAYAVYDERDFDELRIASRRWHIYPRVETLVWLTKPPYVHHSFLAVDTDGSEIAKLIEYVKLLHNVLRINAERYSLTKKAFYAINGLFTRNPDTRVPAH